MRRVELIATPGLSARRLAELRRLVAAAFEGDFRPDDWTNTLGGWHVIVTDSGVLVAHAAVVSRTLEADGRAFLTGYVEAVASHPARRGEGFGTLATRRATGLIVRHHALGALSTGLHSFYERLGWERWLGPTFVRRGGEAVRTEEDDDGVMVLRFGPSAGIDRSGPIICDDRAGDVW